MGRSLQETTMLTHAPRPLNVAAALRALALRWPALVASALGAAIVFAVGFASPELIHDAAHDTRHSINFPCH
jgi:cobalt transporter subunit CbtB